MATSVSLAKSDSKYGTYDQTKRKGVSTTAYPAGDPAGMTTEEILAARTNTPKSVGNTSNQDYIKQMYDAYRNSQLSALEASYNQSRSDMEASRAQIQPTYQASANDVAAAAGRNKQSFNQYAAATGLNSGAGGQAALAMGAQLQGDLGNVRTAEATALSEADRQIADLAAQYRAQLAQTGANIDFQRGQALLGDQQTSQANAREDAWRQQQLGIDQQNTEYSRNLQMAETLAQYGDFSGYTALGYTPEQIQGMKTAWTTAQTPTYSYTGGTGDDTSATYDLSGLYQAMKSSGMPTAYLSAHYKDYGLTAGQLNNILDEYNKWDDTASADENMASAAAQYVQSHGTNINQQALRLWLASQGYTEQQMKTFMEYLSYYGGSFSAGGTGR